MTDVLVGRGYVDVRPNFDNFDRDLSRQVDASGGSAGKRFSTAFGKSLKVGLITATAGLTGGALATGGLLAGVSLGFAGLGAAALKSNKQVKSAFTDMAKSVEKTAASAAAPLVTPFTKAARQISGTVKTIAPELKSAFSALAPSISPLVSGIDRLVTNMLPGMVTALRASQPVVKALGTGLANLGTGLSGFFAGLSTGARGGAQALGSLLGSVGTILSTLGRLLGTLAQAGGPVVATLLKTLMPVIDLLASRIGSLLTSIAPALQTLIGAIGPVISTLIKAVAPLIATLGSELGPVLATLGPPLQILIKALGSALQPVLKALGPVLAAAAGALGSLVKAVSPLLPVIGQLVADLLPALTPIFTTLGTLFSTMAPTVKVLATALGAILKPILAVLPVLLQPVTLLLTTLGQTVFPVLTRLIVALSPSLVILATAFAKIAVALTPVLNAMARFTGYELVGLAKILTPLIGLVGKLATFLANNLAGFITKFVVPALHTVSDLLSGNFSKAAKDGKAAIKGLIDNGLNNLTLFPKKAARALAPLAAMLAATMQNAGARMVEEISVKILNVVADLENLPIKAAHALGNLGSTLFSSGAALMTGFMEGVVSKEAAILSKVEGFIGKISNYFPHSPAKVGPLSGRGWVLYSGQSIATAMAAGISSRQGAVLSAAQSLAATAQQGLGGVSMAAMASPVGSAQSKVSAAQAAVNQLSSHTSTTARKTADTRLAAAKQELANAKAAAAGVKNLLANGWLHTLETGTAASIASAVKSMNTKLQKSSSTGGLVSADLRSGSKLESLANRKASLASTVSTAQKYATSEAGSLTDYLSIGNSQATSVGGLISQMTGQQQTAKAYASEVALLKKRGLNKTLLSQVADQGPGGPLAGMLSGASNAELAQLNKLAASGGTLATSFGQTMSNAMYDSGSQAGKGFLSGLKAQEASLQKEMDQLADGMVDTLKKRLGIHSPSKVLHDEVGVQAGAGVETGVLDHLPKVKAAALRMADALTLGAWAGVPMLTGTAGASSMDGQRLKLVVGDQEFDAYVATAADRRVASTSAAQSRAINRGRKP